MSGRSPTQMDLYIKEVKRLRAMKVPFTSAVRQAIGPHGSADLFVEVQREMTRRSVESANRRRASANKAAPQQKGGGRSWPDGYYDN